MWDRLLDRGHLQNWLPGVLGVSAVILLSVVAANSPTQTNSKPVESPPSQSAALATKGQTDASSPSQPAAPQPPSVAAKAVASSTSASVVTTGEAARPAPAH